MTNGRIDMMDIMGMMSGGDLDLTPPKSCGRIVTGFNGLILGLETKEQILEDKTVYAIESKNDILTLKKVGKSHVNFDKENKDIGTLLLTESTKLILTAVEKDRLELEQEIEIDGFLTVRDKYLVDADKDIEGAEAKVKVLCIMYPMSKHPEKWV